MTASDLAELALGASPAVRLRYKGSGQLPNHEAARIVEDVLAAIRAEVWRTGRVEIPGFGVFTVRQRASKRIRNPDGTDGVKPAHRVVTFRPAKAWRAK